MTGTRNTMNHFPSAQEVKEFLVPNILGEVKCENVPLS
jgi:hypothetical protein